MKRTSRRTVLAVLTVLACAFAYHFATSGRDVVTVGYVSSLSGRFSALSGSGRDGAALAVEQVNAAGGVAGRRLKLAVMDDGFDEERASNAVAELARQGVKVIIGPFASAMAAPMIETAQRYGVLIVSPTVSSDVFSGKRDLFVRLIPTTAAYSRALGEHMSGKREVKTLTVLVDQANAVYTASALDFVKEGFLGGGGTQLRVVEYDSRKSPSFQTLASRALEGKPDAVLMISSPLDTALLCQHLRMADPATTLFSSAWGMSSEMIQNGGRAVEGVESVVPFNPSSSKPTYLEFVRQYRERYGRDPDFASMYNFEVVMLLAKVLGKQPDANGTVLLEILLAMGRQEGLQAPYVLDPAGDVSRPMFLLTVNGGRMTAQDQPWHE